MQRPGDEIDIWIVEKALGSGGMGSVYRCHNRSAGRILAAIKVLDSSLRRYPEAEARFIREAEILFGLDHPNIVKVRNVRMDVDPPYLEMEFVEGESLEHRLSRGRVPVPIALEIIDQCASALAYMHGRGVRHRDIKPANVLVQPDGVVKLVDFGLAVETQGARITQQGMTFGTVSYAPPEWITPEDLDPVQWDIYALGVVFYEILTGEMAFPVSGEGSARQQAMQVIVGKQGHASLDPGKPLHEDLRRLVHDMTHADPAQRIQTMEDVEARVAALRRLPLRNAGVTLMPEVMEAPAALGAGADGRGPKDLISPLQAQTTPQFRAPERRPDVARDDLQTDEGPAPMAARTPAAPTPEIPEPRWLDDPTVRWSATGALAGLFVLLAIAATGLVLDFGPAPEVRTVWVELPAPTDLSLDDQRPVSVVGGIARFGLVDVGATPVLRWATGGPECTVERCPGEACAPVCGSGTVALSVTAGDEPQVHVLTEAVATPRDVGLAVSGNASQSRIRATLTSSTGPTRVARYDDSVLTFPEVAPGAWTARIEVGTCPKATPPCDEQCPGGCLVRNVAVTVPWSGPMVPDRVVLDLPVADAPSDSLTKAPPAEAQPPAAVDPEPKPQVTSPPARARVSTAEFADWLAANPEWQADGERGSLQGPNYLPSWSGATPPNPDALGKPVQGVSYRAARAYCRTRGGDLPDLAALPQVPDSFLEWRLGPKPDLPSALGKGGAEPEVLTVGVPNVLSGTVFRCDR